MTIGSAASLSGAAPEVPLPRISRRNGRRPTSLGIGTDVAPQRRWPRPALADDPPRARILLVEDEVHTALELQRTLRDAGFRAVGPVASAEEADKLTGLRRIDGAVIDRRVVDGDDIADGLTRAGIPFVWLTDEASERSGQRHPSAPAVGRARARLELPAALDRVLARGRTRRVIGAATSPYALPPPSPVWPRVFPQL